MSKQKYPQTQNGRNETSTSSGRRLKTEGYCSDKLHAKRDRKRQEADARQTAHELLTTKEKLDLCKFRRGTSSREIKRLQAIKA